MKREGKDKAKGQVLAKRGMGVSVCPLGTGLVLTQAGGESKEFSAHLTLAQAKELAAALLVGISDAQKAMIGIKSVRSLFARGLRIDQIAAELGLTVKEVRAELIAHGLQDDESGLN